MTALNYVLAVAILCLLSPILAIEDPFFFFCGSDNCYDILNTPRDSTANDIKKAYRKVSLIYHPDKNKDPDAVEKFRLISKAYEVLNDEKKRELFNYYLDNPTHYYKVSGHYIMKKLPQTDVGIIIAVIIIFFSILLPWNQQQKYEQAIRFLKEATINNLTLKNGGTKQTIELFRRAKERYETKMAEDNKLNTSGKNKKEKPIKSSNMQKDPIFLNIVDEVR